MAAKNWLPIVLELLAAEFPKAMTAADVSKRTGMKFGVAAGTLHQLALEGRITKVRECEQFTIPALYTLNPEDRPIEEEPEDFSEAEKIDTEFLELLLLQAGHCGGRDPYACAATQEGSMPRFVPSGSVPAALSSSAAWATSES